MKNVMLAGVLTAMMLTSAATAAVPYAQGINNANNADSAGIVITVTSSAKASRKCTAVKLSRLSDCKGMRRTLRCGAHEGSHHTGKA